MTSTTSSSTGRRASPALHAPRCSLPTWWLVPATPSPFDGWASAEMLRLLGEARVFRPELVARFVLNRCAARTVIARETGAALADHDPPALASRVGQRIAFADAARTGRLVGELDGSSAGAREIAALAAEIVGLVR